MNQRFLQHQWRQSSRRLISTALLLFLLGGATSSSLAQGDAEKQQQLNTLNQEMRELRKLLDQYKSHRSDLETNLRKSELEIGELQKKINSIQKQLEAEQKELQSLQEERKQLKGAQRDQQKFIEQQILQAYQIGQQKKLKVLLNQEQPEKVSRSLTYYDYFNQARAEQIENYIDIISKLDSIEPQIVNKTTTLHNAKSALSREHRRLRQSQQDRNSNLAKINSSIKSKDQELRNKTRDRAELEKLLQAVGQTLANIKIPNDHLPFKQQKGKLPWPVQGKAMNRFGSHRSDGKLRWQGLSISAREGSQVQAIHHGRVVFADWLRGSGLLIIIDHGDGYMSLYAHNQSLMVETGDWIDGGETIATVGSSGGMRSSGLYFEIRHKGTPTDPKRWFRRA